MIWRSTVFVVSAFMVASMSCRQEREGPEPKDRSKTLIIREDFGRVPDGTPVHLYTMINARGCRAKVTDYGGILVSLEAPDRSGHLSDVVLGFDRLEPYLDRHPYFGAIIGRYGNRIGKARFTLDGTEYSLAANNGENHLHGGVRGFDTAFWKADVLEEEDGQALLLKYLSKDGEEGYPGNLSVEVIYRWTADNVLRIDYRATTDKKTVVNLTHHSYFNLKDAGATDILGHELMIRAGKFTPVDQGLIPTGELRSVRGTPMDFTEPTTIGARIESDDEQLRFGGGYDHNWVLNGRAGALALAARLYEPATGRVMEVHTTEPGLQFYSGNFLDGTLTGKGGTVYRRRAGLCLETQHFPDSPNRPDFPSTVLDVGEVYRQTTTYTFGAR